MRSRTGLRLAAALLALAAAAPGVALARDAAAPAGKPAPWYRIRPGDGVDGLDCVIARDDDGSSDNPADYVFQIETFNRALVTYKVIARDAAGPLVVKTTLHLSGIRLPSVLAFWFRTREACAVGLKAARKRIQDARDKLQRVHERLRQQLDGTDDLPPTQARKPLSIDLSYSSRSGMSGRPSIDALPGHDGVGPHWTNAFSAWLERHAYYPTDAGDFGEHGDVVVDFVVEADGAVRSLHLVTSSGEPLLDTATLSMFRDAALPPLPPQDGATLPIRFTTRYTIQPRQVRSRTVQGQREVKRTPPDARTAR